MIGKTDYISKLVEIEGDVKYMMLHGANAKYNATTGNASDFGN